MGDHSRHGSEYSVANEYYGLFVVIAIRLLAEHAEGDTNTDIGGNEYTLQTISDYQYTNKTDVQNSGVPTTIVSCVLTSRYSLVEVWGKTLLICSGLKSESTKSIVAVPTV